MKRTLQLLALAVGLLVSIHSAHAQYPYYQQVLLNERVGFGQNATGGAGGEVYWVTSLANDGPGTLRWGLQKDDNPRWIMFAVNGAIYLADPIQVRSNKTIDGRGASITLNNHGMWIGTFDANVMLHGSRNVIVENITIANGVNAALDGIMIQEGATDVWVDHCTFTNLPRNSLDVWAPRPSVYSDVTVSWCRFTSQVTGVLIGHEPGAPNGQNIRVTLHHNFFNRVEQRSPFIRRALVHAFNNYLFDWKFFGMGSFDSGQLRTENNIFYAGANNKNAVIFSHPAEPTPPGYAKNLNNWNLNGAVTYEYNPNGVFDPAWYYAYAHILEPAINNFGLATKIQTHSGATRTSAGFANMSTRAHVQSGQGNLISGMYISGSGSKKVAIRAIGPSLAPWIPGAMGNTVLRIFNSAGTQIEYNDNWGDHPRAGELQASGLAPSHNLEAAVLVNLAPGSYSAVIDGWGTGIASIEVYDLDASTTSTSKLVNISSRASVDPNSPPIAGLILDSGMKKVIVRGIGPSLGNYGIQNPISDPTLTLHDANGTQIGYNNNWQENPDVPAGWGPSDWREAVITLNLGSGNYTAILRDYYNYWGIGSLEVYKL